jgi:hypothetical protein
MSYQTASQQILRCFVQYCAGSVDRKVNLVSCDAFRASFRVRHSLTHHPSHFGSESPPPVCPPSSISTLSPTTALAITSASENEAVEELERDDHQPDRQCVSAQWFTRFTV